MRFCHAPAAIALRAVGMRARGAPQRSAAGSYSSTMPTLLLPLETNAPPTRPPMTYTLPLATAATAWFRGVGMDERARQVLVAGSYSSTTLVEKCGRAGCTASDPGSVVAPPMTYILSPTVTATGEPRLV